MHNKICNQYYFINKFDTNNINRQSKNTAIIYRNYNSINHLNIILKIKAHCKNNGYKFFLANNIKLANKLDLDGAYIPSFNKKMNHLSYSYKKIFNHWICS